jgi:hypothetical protein
MIPAARQRFVSMFLEYRKLDPFEAGSLYIFRITHYKMEFLLVIKNELVTSQTAPYKRIEMEMAKHFNRHSK